MTMQDVIKTVSQDRPKSVLHESLDAYRHKWPSQDLANDPRWALDAESGMYTRSMPETDEELNKDSRWPATFPCAISLVSASDGETTVLEREVGVSIVNRFPYVAALSICRKALSSRHHPRFRFGEILEKGGCASLQFLPPGPELDKVIKTIYAGDDSRAGQRMAETGLPWRKSVTNDAPVFAAAYMVCEAKLVKPGFDFEGKAIFPEPWVDVGSHRIYFLEINAIQLREDIARGQSQVKWRSLPFWEPQLGIEKGVAGEGVNTGKYQKGYTPHYSYPAASTAAFEFDDVRDGMAIKHLPPLPQDQVEVDNDRARWPCFFPSSVGMITTWMENGMPNVMPCGSTTVVARQPLTISPCISYAKINERYAPRATLDAIRRTGKFGCGVPYVSDAMVQAIKYAGNTSIADDPEKVTNSGLTVEHSEYGPVLTTTPIHFDCEVTGEIRLGTHFMFLGKVKRIRVRADVTVANPLEWCPWAAVAPVAK